MVGRNQHLKKGKGTAEGAWDNRCGTLRSLMDGCQVTVIRARLHDAGGRKKGEKKVQNFYKALGAEVVGKREGEKSLCEGMTDSSVRKASSSRFTKAARHGQCRRSCSNRGCKKEKQFKQSKKETSNYPH